MITPPLPHAIMIAVLTFVMAIGGYGGYTVFKDDDTKFKRNFEDRLHKVTQVIDGDTIIVDDAVTVRLLGVDAPEMGKCYGKKAQEELAKLTLGKRVKLDKDQVAEDVYGRLLRYVILHNEHPEADNVMINRLILKQGHARHNPMSNNKRYRIELAMAQGEAMREGRGLWSKCDYTTKKRNANTNEQSVEAFSDECVIKGNLNKFTQKAYYIPGCPNYSRVKIDPRKGESWFCTEAEAKKAGFKKSKSCSNLKRS